MNNNLEIGIGEKIKSFRKKREITQEQLADYLNISFQSVSKWECGDAYPDITMLPKIAVFFGVTTDELLCIDKLKEQEDIKEYRNRSMKAMVANDMKEAVAVMREINIKYPGNFRIMNELASTLYHYAYSIIDMEDRKNAFKEIISLGEKVRAECKEDKIRHGILRYMCVAYKDIGESEKAINLAKANFHKNILDSDVAWFTNLFDGDELIAQKQNNMIEYAYCFFTNIQNLSRNCEPEYRLAICNNILNMYFLIFKDGDFLFYNYDMPDLYENIAEIYIKLNNNEKVLENLKHAADHITDFYLTLTAFKTVHTSPLVNKVNKIPLVNNTQLMNSTNLRSNIASHFLKNLDDEKYDFIRETPEFIEICENLKIHAKEEE